MYGYGKIRAVKFAEPAAGTGIRVLYDRFALPAFFKHIGRTESATDTAFLAPVLENFLRKKFFSFFVKLLFYFPVIVRRFFLIRCGIAFLFSFGHGETCLRMQLSVRFGES